MNKRANLSMQRSEIAGVEREKVRARERELELRIRALSAEKGETMAAKMHFINASGRLQ